MLYLKQTLNNRYQLQQQLSENAGCQTWLAQDLELQELVIIKLLQYSPQLQWDAIKLFEREAKVLKQLKHPKIPQYYDYFTIEQPAENTLPWFALVQEYIPGKSFQQLLDEGKKFSATQVKSYAIQILEILSYLHELSPPVLHRDIKPSNLILGKHEQIYLVDFGAVQDKAVAEGVTFTVVGTGGYAPPEQFWGKAVPASDLYALGATLVHLLTGIAPADLPQQNLRIQFDHKINLDLTNFQWLEKLIEPAVEQRFKTAREAIETIKIKPSTKTQNSQNKPNNSIPIRYGRLGFLTFLQLVTIGIALSIVLPSLMMFFPANKSAEGKQSAASINRAQQAYFLKANTFADSIEKLEEITTQNKNYQYSIIENNQTVFNYVISKKKNLKTYIGGVYLIHDSSENSTKTTDEKIPQSVLCESIHNGPLPLLYLPNKNGILQCPTGTQQIK